MYYDIRKGMDTRKCEFWWDRVYLPPVPGGWDSNTEVYAPAVWGNGDNGRDLWGWPLPSDKGPMRLGNFENIKGACGEEGQFDICVCSPGKGSTDFAFICRMTRSVKYGEQRRRDVFCQYFSNDKIKQGFRPDGRDDIIDFDLRTFTINLPPVAGGWANTRIITADVWGSAGVYTKEDHWGYPKQYKKGPMSFGEIILNEDDNTASFEMRLDSPGEGSTHLAFICRLLRRNEHDVFCRFFSNENF